MPFPLFEGVKYVTPREEAIANAPEGVRWVSAATQALNVIIGFNGKRSEIENLSQFKAQKTHFHVELGPSPSGLVHRLLIMLPFVETDPTLKLLKEIRFRYFDIARVLSNASSTFVEAPRGGGAENVGMAPAFTPRNRNGTIGITPYYQDVGPLAKVHCLVHESAHFLGDAFQDYAYRDRTGEIDPDGYVNLGVQYAIRNPDSYANFAVQMAKGIDRVIKGED
jgi:hypothetical protein